MMWYATIAAILFPAYFLIDVNYFIRSAFTIIFAKSRKRIKFLDPSVIYGFVLPSDIDFLLTHMNNARFLREMDFARIDHGTRSGFLEEAMCRGGMILLSSSFIRYRLPLPVFSRYKIVTNVVWWDEKNVYLTHKLITLKDSIVRAVVYARASCLKVDVYEISELLNPGIQKPKEIPPDYQKWMETLELSSQLMKASNCAVATTPNGKESHSCESKENGNGNLLSCKLTSNQDQYSDSQVNLMHSD